VFYQKAAALKDKCNRNDQEDPDTTVITIVVKNKQPPQCGRKSNGSLTTPQQDRMPPVGRKKTVNVTASLGEDSKILKVLANTMLLLSGKKDEPDTDFSLQKDFGIEKARAMEHPNTSKFKVGKTVAQVTQDMIAASGQTGEIVEIGDAQLREMGGF
jgi:hypothetical protein